MPPSKASLRKQAIAHREQLPIEEISLVICRNLSQWLPFQEARDVLFYHSYRNEVDLHPLLTIFPEKNWFLPAIIPIKSHQPNTSVESDGFPAQDTLLFRQVDKASDLKIGKYGILEPPPNSTAWEPSQDKALKTLILVPGLCFDRQGYRLGYGKGYYDRFLSQPGVRESLSQVVGVTPSTLVQPNVCHEPWDVPMTHLASELGIVELGYDAS